LIVLIVLIGATCRAADAGHRDHEASISGMAGFLPTFFTSVDPRLILPGGQ